MTSLNLYRCRLSLRLVLSLLIMLLLAGCGMFGGDEEINEPEASASCAPRSE